MQNNYITYRLLLDTLTIDDAAFICELVNTPGWIKFIGDRNIANKEDAEKYIQKIISNPDTKYWVVKTKDQQCPIGIITFIKRNYLEYHDIGFAFLPGYTQKGFAYEATFVVLKDAMKSNAPLPILATTLITNTSSIKLLEKLGFQFHKEVANENDLLQVYIIRENQLQANET